MTAAALAILSSLSGAMANLLAQGISRFASPRDYLAINFGLMFILLIPGVPFFWHLEFNWVALFVLLSASLIDLVANFFYFRSFEDLDAVSASSILALSPVITLFFIPLFMGGKGIDLSGYAGIMLVSTGLVLLSRGSRKQNVSGSHLARTIWFPLAAATLFGLNVFVIKILFSNQWSNPFTYYFVRSLVICVVGYLYFKPDHSWINRSTILYSLGRLVFVISQWMFLLVALDMGNPAKVKALSDSSPIFVAGLSWIVIKEPINRWQLFSVVVVMAGIGLLTLI